VADTPVAMFAEINGLSITDAATLAKRATFLARQNAPKLSGRSAKRIYPYWGEGFFGVKWADTYVWFQDQGISPFTMSSLEGKTIPMWINDPTGTEQAANPKAETRTRADGVTQVLIFRKVGKKGSTKQVKRNGHWSTRLNTNYPGGAGRIAIREAAKPFTTAGRVGGRIAKGNVGVSWRHPGIEPRNFLYHGIDTAARENGIYVRNIFSETINGDRQRVMEK
jgi:hypothetical protein